MWLEMDGTGDSHRSLAAKCRSVSQSPVDNQERAEAGMRLMDLKRYC